MNEIEKIITEYHITMNQHHKQIFHEKAQERFVKLFMLSDDMPEFFTLQNRQKSFFYKQAFFNASIL